MKKIIFCLFLCMSINHLFPQWKEINEGINYGYINDLYIKENNWLLSTAGGGFYKSSNNGEKWLHLDKNLESNVIYKILSCNDTIIYVNSMPNVFISTDFGENWIKSTIDKYQTEQPYSLAYFHQNIYLGLKSNTVMSTDFGQTWIDKSYTTSVLPRLIDKLDTNVVISNNSEVDICNQNLEFISKILETNSSNIYLLKVIDDVIFSSKFNNLFISNDKGKSWDSIKVGNAAITNLYKKDNTFYIKSDSIYISKDNCKTWITKGFLHKYGSTNSITSLNDSIYYSTETGLYKVFNDGDSVNYLCNGIHSISTTKTILKDKVYMRAVYDKLYSFDLNTKIYTDLTNKWNVGVFETTSVSKIFEYEKYILVPHYKALHISKDGGKNWYIPNFDFCSKRCIGINLIDNEFIFNFWGFGIYSTKDFGETWTEHNAGFVNKTKTTQIYRSLDNLIAQSIDSLGNQVIFRTKIGDYNWSIDTNLNFLLNPTVFDLNENVIAYSPIFKVMYLSSDLGKSWVTKNLKFFPVNIKVFKNNILCRVLNQGIYLSTDLGDTWTNITGDLANRAFNDIQIIGEYIYIFSSYSNYYAKLSDFGLSSIEEPKTENDNYLYSFPAYPVPSNNGYIRAMIYWDNKDDIDNAEITITNSIGEIIPTENRITLDKSGPNNGTLNWNCSGYPKGAYFIKIQHGDKSNTLKVIVE